MTRRNINHEYSEIDGPQKAFELPSSSLKLHFWSYYSLALHNILAISVNLFMDLYVDGIVVTFIGPRSWYYSSSKRGDFMQASDITTMVSAAVVVVRIASASWATISAWRCAFIILEHGGVMLQNFNRIVSWKLYWPGWTGWTKETTIACLSLLLLTPATLVTPVITGAFGWEETMIIGKSVEVPYHCARANVSNW
jgi:hypothetical protein